MPATDYRQLTVSCRRLTVDRFMAKKDLIKSGLLLGLGLYSLTKEGIEKLVKQLEKEQHISAKEGKAMVAELVREIKSYQIKTSKFIESEILAAVRKMGLATQKDLKNLERKLAKKNKSGCARIFKRLNADNND